MSTEFRHRRGTTSEHSTFTGAAGEITVDTTKKTAVVHDGATAGGLPLARESALNALSASLGTASTANVQTAYDDTNAGRVLTVGGFGVGNTAGLAQLTDFAAHRASGMYSALGGTTANAPTTDAVSMTVVATRRSAGLTFFHVQASDNRSWNGVYNGTTVTWLAATFADSGWISPTFQNSFSAESSYPMQYRTRDGLLFICGAAKRNTTPTSGLTIFTLPSGSRPDKTGKYLPALIGQTSPLYLGFGSITVGVTGAVNVDLPLPSSGTGTDNFAIYVNVCLPLA